MNDRKITVPTLRGRNGMVQNYFNDLPSGESQPPLHIIPKLFQDQEIAATITELELKFESVFNVKTRDSVLTFTVTNFPKLKRLHIDRCTGFSPEKLSLIANLPDLQSLHLGRFTANDNVLSLVSEKCTKIQTLGLCHTGYCKKDSIDHILASLVPHSFANLTELDLRHSDIRTSLPTIVKQWPQLQRLNLEGCDQILVEAFQSLTSLSSLKYLNIYHTAAVDQEFLLTYVPQFKSIEKISVPLDVWVRDCYNPFIWRLEEFEFAKLYNIMRCGGRTFTVDPDPSIELQRRLEERVNEFYRKVNFRVIDPSYSYFP
jgi:hypothetical protein